PGRPREPAAPRLRRRRARRRRAGLRPESEAERRRRAAPPPPVGRTGPPPRPRPARNGRPPRGLSGETDAAHTPPSPRSDPGRRMREVLTEIESWRAAGEDVALATVVETWGSAPRAAGSKMALTAGGRIAGSVSGGCVEGAVVEAGLRILRTGKPEL